METMWFKKVGWIYIPVHFMGFLITLSVLIGDVWLFLAIDKNSHPVSDTLISFFVFFSCSIFWWKWIADKTSD